jgi:hypothetical protein
MTLLVAVLTTFPAASFPQAVFLGSEQRPAGAPPGVLPKPDLVTGRELEVLDLADARIDGVLAALAERDDVPFIAEVYPGSEWHRPRPFSIGAGPQTTIVASVAEAYDYEWGEVQGVYVLRKNRPWQQPAPEGVGGPFVARRQVWDGERVDDRITELACDDASFGAILQRLSDWRTEDVPQRVREADMARGFLTHPDFAERRIFARLANMPTSGFVQAAAACVGAAADVLPPNIIFVRSAGMAWRGAEARYNEEGLPEFPGGLCVGDTGAYGPLLSPAKAMLVTECCRTITPLEAERLRQASHCANVREDLRTLCPAGLLIVQDYPTVTVPFEELSTLAQLAFIKAIDDQEARGRERLVDRSRPEHMYVTLSMGRVREGKRLASCSVTCRGLDGKLRTF